MKNKLYTMTAAAVLVMSMTGAAHAANTAQLRMVASVAKTTCDITSNGTNGTVTADFGELTQAEVYGAVNTPIRSAKNLVLDFGTCSGADVAANGLVHLIASTYTPAFGSADTAFGDDNHALGYGFNVAASWVNDDKVSTTTTTSGTFTPANDKIEILQAKALTTAATLKLPVVTLTPQVTSWAAAATDIPEDSKVDTTVTFAVAYN